MSSAKTPQQQRQLVLLGALGVILVLVLAYQLWPSGPPAPPAGSTTPPREAVAAPSGRRPVPGSPSARAAAGEVEPVHLERLTAKAPDPEDGRRNPFTMAADAPPPSSEPGTGPRPGTSAPPPSSEPVGPVEPAGPPPPPPVAPITLKFIGTVTVPSQVGRIAAFSDGKFVYYGREGEVIEGRYRIVKIGEESVQMEYADGRGRQTIRLSGK